MQPANHEAILSSKGSFTTFSFGDSYRWEMHLRWSQYSHKGYYEK